MHTSAVLFRSSATQLKSLLRLSTTLSLLALFSLPLRAQNPPQTAPQPSTTASKPVCDPQHPDRCAQTLAPGDQVPFLGLEVTIPTAAALKATLDQCVATLRENKGYCEERLAQDRRASTETVKVVQFQATSREEVLRQALAASQKKELTQVEQVEKEKAGQILWVAVGAGVGLLVGAAVGAGATLYLQSHVTIQVP